MIDPTIPTAREVLAKVVLLDEKLEILTLAIRVCPTVGDELDRLEDLKIVLQEERDNQAALVSRLAEEERNARKLPRRKDQQARRNAAALQAARELLAAYETTENRHTSPDDLRV